MFDEWIRLSGRLSIAEARITDFEAEQSLSAPPYREAELQVEYNKAESSFRDSSVELAASIAVIEDGLVPLPYKIGVMAALGAYKPEPINELVKHRRFARIFLNPARPFNHHTESTSVLQAVNDPVNCGMRIAEEVLKIQDEVEEPTPVAHITAEYENDYLSHFISTSVQQGIAKNDSLILRRFKPVAFDELRFMIPYLSCKPTLISKTKDYVDRTSTQPDNSPSIRIDIPAIQQLLGIETTSLLVFGDEAVKRIKTIEEEKQQKLQQA